MEGLIFGILRYLIVPREIENNVMQNVRGTTNIIMLFLKKASKLVKSYLFSNFNND